jgi:phage replication O-like protein O
MSDQPTHPNPTPSLSQMPDTIRKRHAIEQMRRFLAGELRRFNLSHRQQTIAEVILDLSLGWGERSARIPRLVYFTEITGINVANVSRAIKGLYEMRILLIEMKSDTVIYTLNTNSDTWQVSPRVPRSSIRKAHEMLKSHNGIQTTQDDELSKDMARLEEFLRPYKETPENFKPHPVDQIFDPAVADSATIAELAIEKLLV